MTATTALAAPSDTEESRSLAAMREQFGIVTDDLDELARIFITETNQVNWSGARASMSILHAQEIFTRVRNPHTGRFEGEFNAWLDSKGIPHERAYESIRIAKFLLRLPDDQRRQAMTLGKSKMLLLAKVPQEVIEREAEGEGLLAEAETKTLKELREDIESMARARANCDAQIEKLELENQRLKRERPRATGFHAQTEATRAESLEQQYRAEWHLRALQKMFVEELKANGTEEHQMRLEQVWGAAHSAVCVALDVVAHLRGLAEQIGREMPERTVGAMLLTEDEAREWLLWREQIENNLAVQQALRRERLLAEQEPKGPGRPKGSKSAKGKKSGKGAK